MVFQGQCSWHCWDQLQSHPHFFQLNNQKHSIPLQKFCLDRHRWRMNGSIDDDNLKSQKFTYRSWKPCNYFPFHSNKWNSILLCASSSYHYIESETHVKENKSNIYSFSTILFDYIGYLKQIEIYGGHWTLL